MLDWAVHIAVAVAIGLVIVNYVAQLTLVWGNSMLPTLQNWNILIIEKITPRFGHLERGNIVTLNVPEMIGEDRRTVIKRIIGVEGDTVELRDGRVYLNNEPLKEEYVNGNSTLPINSQYSKVTVEKGYIYVMGDNRMPGASDDSRRMGPLKLEKVGGKAVLRLMPVNKIGIIK